MGTMSGLTTILDRARARRWFHALADGTRLRILERLVEGEQCVCHLTEALGGGQSRLSFHLKTLKEAGLVTARRQGRWVYYSLNGHELGAIRELIEEMQPARRSLRAVSRWTGAG